MKIKSETWSRVTELFDEVAELPPMERQRYLDATAPPADVRRFLEQLLAAHDTPDTLLVDEPVDEVVARMLGEADESIAAIPEQLAGRRFGNWEAREELGRGGMSVVLSGTRADGQFDKEVAIKVLPPGPAGAARKERLLQEIRLLARLEHAGIARLLDGGLSEEGLPYLVMEHVDGLPITRYCERHELGLKARVGLFLEAAEAVAHSHRSLVVHCDIKPSNVLVNRDGVVKLVDFGIASLLSESASQKDEGRPLLRCSPAYAAPEQLRGDPPSVSHDIFALGTLLYELLTDERIRGLRRATSMLFGGPVQDDIQPPSDRAARRDKAPVRARELRGDLDAICMKALALDPRDRYPEVGALISDLRRWLASEPVVARGGGTAYRASKWLARHRWGAASASLAALSLILGSGAALWQAQEATRAADIAESEKSRAESALAETEEALQRSEALHDFLIGLFDAAEPDRPGEDMPTTRELLELGAERAMDEEAVPPSERLGMLLAIARVHASLNEYERADPLVLEAVALARERAEERPEDLSRALRLKASIMREAGNVEEMMEVAQEAEDLVAGEDRHWHLYARARSERAWLHRHRREYERAVELLRPLKEEMSERGDVPPRVRANILGNLASSAASAGELEAAAGYQEQALETYAAQQGRESRQYAVSLSNSANLERQLGNFDLARDRAEKALALYDRIFADDPQAFRAAARRGLARTLMATGDYDAAMEALDESGREWAEFAGRDLDEWEYHFMPRGSFQIRMGRLDEGVRDLEHAQELIHAHEQDPTAADIIDMLVAWADCRRGLVARGWLTLQALEARLDGNLEGDPGRAAQLQEARAECRFATGDAEGALKAVDRALETHSVPGALQENVQRQLLRGRILTRLGQTSEAESALHAARAVLDDAGMEDDHPLHAVIARTESRLERTLARH